MSTTFTASSAFPLHRQVAAWLEGRIVSGELSAGDRLPSTDGLASELGVGRKVIQQALASLSERGLLDRSPGRGTFVSLSINSRRIAVVFATDLLSGEKSNFNRLVCNEFLKDARRRGFQVSLFFPTDTADLGRCKRELEQLARQGEIRGIVSFGNLGLRSSSVPCIVGAAYSAPDSPRESLAFRGLSYLISRGYQSIAVMEHNSRRQPSDATRQAVEQIQADMVALPQISLFQDGALDCDGRTVMSNILATSNPAPQALLSLDDNLTRGAIFAILEHGLRIPEDIAVLSHANKGSAILSPVPLTLLEHDPAEYAAHALEALEARLDGRKAVFVASHPRLHIGASCGEQQPD
jgi:DNA-binding LacI/PurR family transcriptional regulator